MTLQQKRRKMTDHGSLGLAGHQVTDQQQLSGQPVSSTIRWKPARKRGLFMVIVFTSCGLQFLPAFPTFAKTAAKPIQKKSDSTNAVATPVSTKAPEQHNSEDPLKRAQAIIDKLSHLDHPETRVPRGSIGWQEEQQAAQQSTQSKIDAAQAELIGLGNRIVPILAKNINSPSKDVQNVCTNLLGLFGSASIPSLTEIMKQYGPTQPVVTAIKAVGPDMVPPILVLLKSNNEQERATAIHVLNALLPDRNDPFHHINRVHYRTIPAFAFGATNNEPFILSMPAVSRLCELAKTEKSVKNRSELVQLLGRVGQRSDLVSKTLMSESESDEEPSVRDSALVALQALAAQLNGDAATDLAKFLAARLKNDEYEGCRCDAAIALGKLSRGGEIAVPALSDAIQDANLSVCTAAMNSLGAFGEQAGPALPALMHCIQSAPESQEANTAMMAIGRLGNAGKPALPLLISNLSNSHRRQAVDAIGQIGPAAAGAVDSLIPLLGENDDFSMRWAVINALGRIGPDAAKAAPRLREIARTNNRDSSFAKQALKKITGSDDTGPATEPSAANHEGAAGPTTSTPVATPTEAPPAPQGMPPGHGSLPSSRSITDSGQKHRTTRPVLPAAAPTAVNEEAGRAFQSGEPRAAGLPGRSAAPGTAVTAGTSGMSGAPGPAKVSGASGTAGPTRAELEQRNGSTTTDSSPKKLEPLDPPSRLHARRPALL